MSSELEDFEAGIQRTESEIYAAEDALIKAGFPAEHWRLIRNYILAAILHHQMRATGMLSRIGSQTLSQRGYPKGE